MEAWLSKHQSMQTSKKGCRAWPQLRRQLQAPLGSCARTLLLKASLISLSLCRTQGLASAADKVEDNLGITKRAPILLMHGAIQGGWVWEFPRISQGAARVRAKLQCHELTLASSLPAPQAGAHQAGHHPGGALSREGGGGTFHRCWGRISPALTRMMSSITLGNQKPAVTVPVIGHLPEALLLQTRGNQALSGRQSSADTRKATCRA